MDEFEATPPFCDAGRGSFPVDLRRVVLEEVAAAVAEKGWDQPFLVLGIRWTGRPEALSGVVVAASLGLSEVFAGVHPYADLPGRSLPPTFDAAVLVTEGWDYPDHVKSLTPEELVAIGPPSAHTDRVEVRLLSFVSRRGEEATLFLRYASREAEPEQAFIPGPTGGRVRDVFRRFVGLPLPEPATAVASFLGRCWAGAVLNAVEAGFPVVTVMEFDPIAAADPPDGFSVDEWEGHLQDQVKNYSWRALYDSADSGLLPVVFPAAILNWCDVGMFARMLLDETPSQAESLDAIMAAGEPVLAIELYHALSGRGWLETDLGFSPEEELLLASDDPCSCGSGRPFGRCHGAPW